MKSFVLCLVLTVAAFNGYSQLDSFDNCSLWTSMQGGGYSPFAWSSSLACDASASSAKLTGHEWASGTGDVWNMMYKPYTFLTGKKYVIKVRYRTTAYSQGFDFWVSAATAFNSGSTTGLTNEVKFYSDSRTTVLADYITATILYVPTSDKSLIAISGRPRSAGWITFPTYNYNYVEVDWIEITEATCTGTATITGPADVCENSTSQFTITEGLAYYWNTPNWPLMTRQISPYSYVPGSYTMTGYVLDASGCVGVATKAYQINALPTTAISATLPISSGVIYSCAGGNNLSLTAAASPSSTVIWYLSDLYGATGATLGSSPTYTINNSASSSAFEQLFYKAEVTDIKGCKVQARIEVRKNPNLSTLWAEGPTTISEGGSPGSAGYVPFRVSQAGSALSYRWTRDGNDIPGVTGPYYEASVGGVYQVFTNQPNGCVAVSNQLPFTVYPRPTISANGTLCLGVTLTSSPGTTYAWQRLSTAEFPYQALPTTQSIVTTIPGTYSVWVTKPGQPVGVSVYVEVKPLPTVSISGQSTIGCPASTVLTASGAQNYTWSPGSTLSSTTGASVTASPREQYNTYYVTGVDQYGCTSTSSLLVSVILGEGSIAQSGTLCQGGPGIVWLQAGAGSEYSWGSPQMQVTAPSSYNVFYKDIQGCPVMGTTYVEQCRDNGGYDDFRIEAVSGDDGKTIDPSDGKFMIYPNPAVNEIKINLEGPAMTRVPVEIIDIVGRQQILSIVPEGETQVVIDVRQLVSGTYLIRVGDQKPIIQKLVIRK